jgi:integrase
MSRVFQREKNGPYWIDFKDVSGVRRRRKIGPSKRVAREVLDGILGNIARRQHLGIIDDSAISLADFAEEWKRRVTPTLKPRSRERWFGIVEKHLKPAFRGALRSITQGDAEAYVARRLETGANPDALTRDTKGRKRPQRPASPSTINREVTVLKHMMRRAVEWEYLSRNPFLDAQGRPLAGLRALKEPAGRTRFLSVEEIERLLSACEASESPYLRPFVMVSINTGMRRNEVLSLTRRSVDFVNSVATLADTKNGEARHVYLNRAAVEALKSLPSRLDGKIFEMGPNQTSMLFVRAAKRAKLENARLHDLRHTFASYQAMSGVAGRGLQVLLGHKDARMTMRYSHLSDAYLRAAVNGVVLGASAVEKDAISEKDGTYLAPALSSKTA